MSLTRAALLGLLCAACAASPELRNARSAGAKSLDCSVEATDAKLEKDNGNWRLYLVECDLRVVRVTCINGEPCQIQPDQPPPRLDPML